MIITKILNMKKDISTMRFYAAELRKELDKTAVEGSYCEVEAYEDSYGPKIEVRSSHSNLEQTTLYCLSEVSEYCNVNELNFYVTVREQFAGKAIPVVVIF